MVRSTQELGKARKTIAIKTLKLSGDKPARKPHRWRRGTVALREIRRYQKGTQQLVQKLPFRRLVREVGAMFKPDLRFTADALEAIQEISESYMIQLFRETQGAAIHAERVKITGKDMEYVLRG